MLCLKNLFGGPTCRTRILCLLSENSQIKWDCLSYLSTIFQIMFFFNAIELYGITILNVSRVHEILAKPRMTVGCWVVSMNIKCIFWIRIGSKCQSQRQISSSNWLNFWVTISPNSQKNAHIANDQNISANAVKVFTISIGFETRFEDLNRRSKVLVIKLN